MPKPLYTLTVVSPVGTFTRERSTAFPFAAVYKHNGAPDYTVTLSMSESGARRAAMAYRAADGFAFCGVFPVSVAK